MSARKSSRSASRGGSAHGPAAGTSRTSGKAKAGSKSASKAGGTTKGKGSARSQGKAQGGAKTKSGAEAAGKSKATPAAQARSRPVAPASGKVLSAAAAVAAAQTRERRRFRAQVEHFVAAAPEAVARAGATSLDAMALAAVGSPTGLELQPGAASDGQAPFPGAERLHDEVQTSLFDGALLSPSPVRRGREDADRAESADAGEVAAAREQLEAAADGDDHGPTLFDPPLRPAGADEPASAADAHEARRAEAPWQRLHRLPCTLGELDLHLFNEGRHRRLWEVLGSHPRELEGEHGTAFSVWAPSARAVSVVGDFCDWDPERYPLRSLGSSGLWELFVPEVHEGALYKFAVTGQDGVLRFKADPLALKHEQFPGDASIVQRLDHHAWQDDAWMAARAAGNPAQEALAIYEVHLSSWARVPEQDDRPLSYREIAPRLVEHCLRFGFTHVQFMPLMEHPFGGSWGYQLTGYFAPTSRHGTPDDFRFLVDTLHQAGLGVLLDWVPGHFPGDAHGLARFDGTPLYEHEDPKEGLHPDWDTLVFNFGRHEVRSFLISSALYWLEVCHADGLRVDAVASMIYRDYSRREGEWVPNRFGGRENLEALEFLRELNQAVHATCPGAITIAEESTAWNGVTRPAGQDGGLGFDFKWNMGWMHDTLAWFGRDPIHRRWHHDQITFAMLYEHSERFINPLSHDEVVHGKGSLLSRMPGDEWQRLANLRALLAYMYTRPGKKHIFMGTELAMPGEWDHDHSLPWHLAADPPRAGLQRFLADLGRLYRDHACLWRDDHAESGFRWIDCTDRENSVLVYERRASVPDDGRDGPDHLVIVLNLTPVPRRGYRIGAPSAGSYRCVLSGDAGTYGGSDAPTRDRPATEAVSWHGRPQSLELDLPPLCALVYAPA